MWIESIYCDPRCTERNSTQFLQKVINHWLSSTTIADYIHEDTHSLVLRELLPLDTLLVFKIIHDIIIIHMYYYEKCP